MHLTTHVHCHHFSSPTLQKTKMAKLWDMFWQRCEYDQLWNWSLYPVCHTMLSDGFLNPLSREEDPDDVPHGHITSLVSWRHMTNVTSECTRGPAGQGISAISLSDWKSQNLKNSLVNSLHYQEILHMGHLTGQWNHQIEYFRILDHCSSCHGNAWQYQVILNLSQAGNPVKV